jgi:hypothetical protein
MLVGRHSRTEPVASRRGGGDWTRFLDGTDAGTWTRTTTSFRGSGPRIRFLAGGHAGTDPAALSMHDGAISGVCDVRVCF